MSPPHDHRCPSVGMTKVDREKVNKVVHEMSKNSAFYAHAKKNDEKVRPTILNVRAPGGV